VNCALALVKPIGIYQPICFERPVFFVAHELKRRWPELDNPDACMNVREVPTERWGPGENIWIVSSYLKLKARGLNVRIVDRLVPDAINVCYLDAVLNATRAHRAFLAIAQGDRCYLSWGDYTLAQSPELAKSANSCLIDMWPQPGLLPRDPSRGDHIKRIGYTGYKGNLAAVFRTDAFRNQLAKLGIELVIRDHEDHWHDFSDLDLHLAIRDTPWQWVRTKPSTKLVHSWITGCPGLLGPEPSYRYWGDDGRDYFEVNSPEDVLRTVARLKNNPELYRAVQRRGWEKAKVHDEDAVCRQWAAVLAGPVTEQYEAWRQAGQMTWMGRDMRRRVQRVGAYVSRKWFFFRVKGRDVARERIRNVTQHFSYKVL